MLSYMRWKLGIGWVKSCVWISSDQSCFEIYYRDTWTGNVRIVRKIPKDAFDRALLRVAVGLAKSREFVVELRRKMKADGLANTGDE